MLRFVRRLMPVVALLAVPAVVWAAEKAGEVACCCCPFCCS